jgi:hypothetical protein
MNCQQIVFFTMKLQQFAVIYANEVDEYHESSRIYDVGGNGAQTAWKEILSSKWPVSGFIT